MANICKASLAGSKLSKQHCGPSQCLGLLQEDSPPESPQLLDPQRRRRFFGSRDVLRRKTEVT